MANTETRPTLEFLVKDRQMGRFGKLLPAGLRLENGLPFNVVGYCTSIRHPYAKTGDTFLIVSSNMDEESFDRFNPQKDRVDFFILLHRTVSPWEWTLLVPKNDRLVSMEISAVYTAL